MKPVIAIVGRPNVGKSTLFNRLTSSRDALVADFAGLTRDRIYGEGKVGERDYILIDTGGISGDETGIDSVMAEQSLQAMAEADAILFLVDAKSGLTAIDQAIADHLRKNHQRVWLVVNKADSGDPDVAAAEFQSIGMANVAAVSATHNRGIASLAEEVLRDFPEPSDSAEEVDRGVKIAIVGRPNVGKSTLVNRMLGEERVVVYDQPGTTRDSVYIPFTRRDQAYTLIDTAGVRRRKNVKETVEKFSIIKTLKAIEDANVVVALFDAHEGIVDQDLHMLSFVLEAGRSLVIAINKWDGLDAHVKERLRSDVKRRLDFVSFAELHFISALHGTAVGDLYKSIDQAYRTATAKWPTHRLTTVLEKAVQEHSPPLVRGRRIKLRYAHQGGSNPPRIIIHGNQTEDVPTSYKRYLQNRFRRDLKIGGTPIFIQFKSGSNPFEGRKNQLTQRQITKKRRLMKHVKKR